MRSSTWAVVFRFHATGPWNTHTLARMSGAEKAYLEALETWKVDPPRAGAVLQLRDSRGRVIAEATVASDGSSLIVYDSRR